MKKMQLFAVGLLLLASITTLIAPRISAAEPNLIPNPSVEQVNPGNAQQPLQWRPDKWGTNNATFTYLTTGHTGRSVRVVVNGYADGDAKWYFDPVAVQPSAQYVFSDYYKSSVQTEVVVQFVDANGQPTYKWIGSAPQSTAWKQFSKTIATPANAKKMSVLHLLNKNGNLQTDDFSLTRKATNSPPIVSITAPTNNATVNNTTTLVAEASDAAGIAGVQFKIDGTNVGAEVTMGPYQKAWDTTTVANGPHTITAVARNVNGLSTTAQPVTVNVQNGPQPGQNIIPNPSAETADPNNAALPLGWQFNRSRNNQGASEYLTTGHSGQRSLKTTITSYTNGDTFWSHAPQPVKGGKVYEFSDYYKSDVDTEVYAHITMQDGSEQWQWVGTAFHTGDWNHFDQQFTVPANAVSADVYHTLYSVGFLITDDYKLVEYTPQGFNRGLVSITFDDAIRSTYTNGLPLLQEFNFLSTQYMLSGYTNDPYYMTVPMMQAFKDAGHEVAAHTVTHATLTSVSPAQLQTELTQSKNDLASWLGTTPTNFATPHGAYNAEVLNAIKPLYRSHRSVDVGFNSKDNFDIYNIKVQNVVAPTEATEIANLVAQAKAEHTWLVLVYHAVDDPANAIDPFWNVTPAQLRSHFTAIRDAGLPVVTVGQALDEITPQL